MSHPMKSIVENGTGKYLWSGENPADKPSLAGKPIIDGVPPGNKHYYWDFLANAWVKDVAEEAAQNAEEAALKGKPQAAKNASTSLDAFLATNPNWAVPANTETAMQLINTALKNLSPGLP